MLGGTPQYQVWGGTHSLERIIKEVVLGRGAPLYEEPLAMLRGEEGIREPATYFGILLAVAQGDTSTSRIAARLQIASSVATRMLDRLRDLGYLQLREPIAVKPQPTRSYWRIKDGFFRFWFRYVFPNRSRLERGLVDDVYQEIRRDLPSFVGFVFENCCREWTGRDSPFAGQSRAVGSWWSWKGDSEIDVVTMDKERYLLLGSCKWTGREIDVSVLDDLYVARADLGPKAAQARLALFARRGFSPVVRERAEREHVMLVTAADLFANVATAE